ncbi:DUF3592 domain-containing protein [Flagellimonas flava]|uniref:DUF3592 domain-containing protein n=1 Tax=Flagellimonas flava TaxID=570519 RepID=UPI003D64AB89
MLGPIVFIIIGISFVYAGLWLSIANRTIRNTGIKTKAKIVDYIEEKRVDADGDGHIYHFPVVNFTNQQGDEITQQLTLSEKPKRTNQWIEIVYLKKENEYHIIKNDDWWEINLPTIFLIFGGLFLAIGIYGITSEI